MGRRSSDQKADSREMEHSRRNLRESDEVSRRMSDVVEHRVKRRDLCVEGQISRVIGSIASHRQDHFAAVIISIVHVEMNW